MKINNPGNTSSAQSTESTSARRVERDKGLKNGSIAESRRSSEAEETKAAKSEISPRARELAKAKEIAKSAPEYREEKIAELRRRIANKEYNVKPEDIAEKMVDDHVQSYGLD